MDIVWREGFSSSEVRQLHQQAFGGDGGGDWWGQVTRHSLGWVCARVDGRLVGWVNVAWDGGAHATLLDTAVDEAFRHQGLATRLVAVAVDEARQVGCRWLHVDFEAGLEAFYLGSCGFRPTAAGLLDLAAGSSSGQALGW